MNRRKIILTGLAWLTLLGFTAVPAVSLGNLDYINGCDLVIMAICVYMKPSIAMLYASSATALADVLLGYGVFSPYTFVIRGLQGWLAGYMAQKGARRISIVLVSGCVVLLGYAVALVMMYGSWQVALTETLYNLIQVTIGIIASLMLARYDSTIKDYIDKNTE